MKIFDHTIYAPNRTPKFDKTSVPSVVNEQTTSGSDISLTNSAFTQFRTSNYTYDANGNVSELIDTAGVKKNSPLNGHPLNGQFSFNYLVFNN